MAVRRKMQEQEKGNKQLRNMLGLVLGLIIGWAVFQMIIGPLLAGLVR